MFKLNEWIKDDIFGYWQVIGVESKSPVIKNGFDRYMKFRLDVTDGSYFRICFSDFESFQAVSDEEKLAIEKYFQEDKDGRGKFHNQTQRYISYRNLILNSNLKEATRKEGHFYRRVTEKTAFILNIKDFGEYVGIVYGFASTAYMAGEENWFDENGADDDSINLRECVEIRTDEDEESAKKKIERMFLQYQHVEKDDLLEVARGKRKEFLQKIADKLKPLGFRKKGAKWTRVLDANYVIEFYAQKSSFSDQYYFNISIFNPAIIFPACFEMRLNTNGSNIYNWQLMTEEGFAVLLDSAINNIIIPIINTPLLELGKREEIRSESYCDRCKCEDCWVVAN